SSRAMTRMARIFAIRWRRRHPAARTAADGGGAAQPGPPRVRCRRMLRARVLTIATLAVGASLAPPARASFGEPVELARGSAGYAFSRPAVVDRALSSAPAVALGPDGTGIVAWTHDHGVYAVSVDAGGRLGKVKRIASPGSVTSLVAAAGRDGAATLAWIG